MHNIKAEVNPMDNEYIYFIEELNNDRRFYFLLVIDFKYALLC
jgi:hypothetical protein